MTELLARKWVKLNRMDDAHPLDAAKSAKRVWDFRKLLYTTTDKWPLVGQKSYFS